MTNRKPGRVIAFPVDRVRHRTNRPWLVPGILERALTDLQLRPSESRGGSCSCDCRDCPRRLFVLRVAEPELRCICGYRQKVAVLIDRRFGWHAWLRGALPEVGS